MIQLNLTLNLYIMKFKLTLLSILGLFAIIDIQSQTYVPFPIDSAAWKVNYNYQADGWHSITSKFFLNGDTAINDISYSKLFYLDDADNNINNGIYLGGIREDLTKKVYFNGKLPDFYLGQCEVYPVNTDILLYDFNVNIGDTLFKNRNTCEVATINSIDSVIHNDSYRKRYEIRVGSTLNDYSIIEGIGSDKGLLYPLYYWFEWSWELLCFDDNFLTATSNNCFLTGIKQVKNNDFYVKIYPNPITENTKITLPKSYESEIQIQILNLQGKTIYSSTIPVALNHYEINPEIFPGHGLYLIKLQVERYSLTKKIIVY